MSFILNKSYKFPLSKVKESETPTLLFIFGGGSKPPIETYTNSIEHLELVKQILDTRFNVVTDHFIGINYTPQETELYLLDPEVITGKLDRLLKRAGAKRK